MCIPWASIGFHLRKRKRSGEPPHHLGYTGLWLKWRILHSLFALLLNNMKWNGPEDGTSRLEQKIRVNWTVARWLLSTKLFSLARALLSSSSFLSYDFLGHVLHAPKRGTRHTHFEVQCSDVLPKVVCWYLPNSTQTSVKRILTATTPHEMCLVTDRIEEIKVYQSRSRWWRRQGCLISILYSIRHVRNHV